MKTLLFLHWRNFGDAVIGLGLIESLRESQPELKIDILTRPEFVFLFENHPFVRKVYTASFPVGTMKRFGLRSVLHLTKEIFQARRRGYEAVANLFGDVRENFGGWLICPKSNYSIVWPADHPVHVQSRIGPAFLLSHPVFIENTTENIYSAVSSLAAALGATASAGPVLYGANRRPILHAPLGRRVGLHVSAGQECRRWPMQKWVDLASMLLAEESEVRIYCAPSERDAVQAAFQRLVDEDGSIAVIAGSLEQFFEDAATCSLFLGHDSFGIHAAGAIGVPRILINGPNVAEVWAPPGTLLMRGNEDLPCYPCFSKPTCTAGPDPYACIRSIQIDAVHRLVHIAEQSSRSKSASAAKPGGRTKLIPDDY